MNLVKIGKYNASKRKICGLTQRELAEKLGKSDKSVSKWERGICLPDVSLYMELCDILGISINEFIAGEDISEHDNEKQFENNLIQVTTDGECKRKKLKKIIAVLLVVSIICASISTYYKVEILIPIMIICITFHILLVKTLMMSRMIR